MPERMDENMTCNVCEREPAVGVASSVFGAISLAYGKNCLEHEADAAFVLAAAFYTGGPDPAGYSDWIWEFKTFRNEEYVTAREYFNEVVVRPGFFDPPHDGR